MKKPLILFLSVSVLLCAGCAGRNSQPDVNRFAGHWIATYFADSLSLNNLSTTGFGSTEILIPESPQDRLVFWNEDVEGPDSLEYVMRSDTLVALWRGEDAIWITLQDNLLRTVYRPGDKAAPYVRADSLLVNTAGDLGMTVVRLMVNRTVSASVYTDEATGQSVRFGKDGSIKGLNGFERYYISISGDEANVDDAVSISFTDSGGKQTKLGLRTSTDGIELCSLKLLTEPGEKPYYATEKPLYRLRAE